MPDKPIVTALTAVMEDVRAVGKDDVNTQQHFNFRGIDAVVNAVGPVLRKHGVVVVPMVDEYRHSSVEVGKNRTPMGHVMAKVTYRFWEASGDYLDVTVVGEAMDSGDKATPKAMSVAFRTALLQALALPTTEPDPDAQTYERAAADVTIAAVDGTTTDPGWLKDALGGLADSKTLDDLEVALDFIKAGSGDGKCSEADKANLWNRYLARKTELGAA